MFKNWMFKKILSFFSVVVDMDRDIILIIILITIAIPKLPTIMDRLMLMAGTDRFRHVHNKSKFQ